MNRSASAVIPLVLLLASCSASVAPFDEEPEIEGVITQAGVNDGVFRVLVEANPEVSDPLLPEGLKLWMSITGSTEILIRSSEGSYAKGKRGDLVAGLTVEGWTTGKVMDSYPGQTRAARLVVEHVN